MLRHKVTPLASTRGLRLLNLTNFKTLFYDLDQDYPLLLMRLLRRRSRHLVIIFRHFLILHCLNFRAITPIKCSGSLNNTSFFWEANNLEQI